MKTDKRLKRGLADLSRFFSGDLQLALKKPENAVLNIEPPSDSSADFHPPRLIFTSFLSASEMIEPAEFIQLTHLMKTAFPEVCLLSLTPNRSRYEGFAQTVPLPAWKEATTTSDLMLHSIGDGITFAYISQTQFQKLFRPEVFPPHAYDVTGPRSALVIFDSLLGQNSTPYFSAFNTSALELMDHCVFIVPPDLNQLQRTYELICACLARNQALRCSLFISGKAAEALWEVVYERFNAIVSKFLACDLGFLGWAEDEQIQLNAEFLTEERKNPAQLPFKASLREMFFLPV